jgi:hypothetical protein
VARGQRSSQLRFWVCVLTVHSYWYLYWHANINRHYQGHQANIILVIQKLRSVLSTVKPVVLCTADTNHYSLVLRHQTRMVAEKCERKLTMRHKIQLVRYSASTLQIYLLRQPFYQRHHSIIRCPRNHLVVRCLKISLVRPQGNLHTTP